MQEARLDLGMSDRYSCRDRGSLEGVGFDISRCVSMKPRFLLPEGREVTPWQAGTVSQGPVK